MGEAVPRRGWRRPACSQRHGCRRGAVVVDAAEAEPFALSDDGQAAAVAETAADIEARPAFYEALYPLLAERRDEPERCCRSYRTCSGQ